MSETKFPEGIFAKEGNVGFVTAKLSFKTEEFIKYLKANTNEKGYCNIDVLKSKKGGLYCSLNDWKPVEQNNTSGPQSNIKAFESQPNSAQDGDLPF